MAQGQVHPWGSKGMLEYFIINLKAFKSIPFTKARQESSTHTVYSFRHQWTKGKIKALLS